MVRLKRRLSRLPFVSVFLTLLVAVPLVVAAVDAPTGYDNVTNGFENQTNFDLDRAQFDTVEQIDDGLGPVYNAQACRECHQNPVSGAATQINEVRAGVNNPDGTFTPHGPTDTLVRDRAINPLIQQHVSDSETTAFRTSLNVLGDGFVEAVPDSEFYRIQNAQPSGVKGTIVMVRVLETGIDHDPPLVRIARFGWKNQHASLLSFAADAYRNEMGITNRLFPTEVVSAFDTVSDPEDTFNANHPFGKDVEAFTRFMRSTEAPPRTFPPTDPPPPDIASGEAIFDQIGCEDCHTDSITTAPAGTVFNGGYFIVDASLGSKTIHPYGDFMLHNIGTGDDIPQGAANGKQIRTAPLWGLRSRTRLMHHGQKLTITKAIQLHAVQATASVNAFNALSATDKANLLAFLNSL